MKDLLLTIARGLVENPDDVSVEVADVNENGVTVTVFTLLKVIWGE